jgi:hypothetical protein
VRFRQGEHELTRAPELGVDPFAGEKGLQLVEVLACEERQAACFVLAEVADRELVRVIESLADLAGVSTRGAICDALAFEEDDVPVRRELLQEERRPQAGEAAADDREVGALLAGERSARGSRRKIGEPEAALFDLREPRERLQPVRLGVRDGAPRRPRPSTRRAPRRTCRAGDS